VRPAITPAASAPVQRDRDRKAPRSHPEEGHLPAPDGNGATAGAGLHRLAGGPGLGQQEPPELLGISDAQAREAPATGGIAAGHAQVQFGEAEHAGEAGLLHVDGLDLGQREPARLPPDQARVHAEDAIGHLPARYQPGDETADQRHADDGNVRDDLAARLPVVGDRQAGQEHDQPHELPARPDERAQRMQPMPALRRAGGGPRLGSGLGQLRRRRHRAGDRRHGLRQRSGHSPAA